jgi:alpha-tubulin suppressor-like RCC1 family protein
MRRPMTLFACLAVIVLGGTLTAGASVAHATTYLPVIQVATPACGLQEFPFPTPTTSSWAFPDWVIPGGGVPVYSNGPTYEGTDTDCEDPGGTPVNHLNGIRTGEEWQCVEFVNRLYLRRGWITGGSSSTAPWRGSAGPTFYNDAPSNLTEQLNGSVPYLGPGDVVIIDVSQYGSPDGGHVLVVNDTSDVKSGTVNLVSQNSGYETNPEPVVSGKITDGTVTVGGGNAEWTYTTYGVVHAPAPTSPPTSPAIAKAVTGHLNGYCALLKSQEVECWGTNQFGLLGDGGTEPVSYVPVYVKGLAGVKSLVDNNGASWLVCAVLVTGRVECWGSNQSGMLGNGGTEAISDTPVAVRNVSDAQSVFTFENGTACAILTTGHVDCWGYNAQGQLGDGGFKSSGVPVAVHGISDATSLSGLETSTCALLGSGGVDCWGGSNYGELGDGGNEAYSNVPVAVRGITSAKGLSGNGATYCAVLASGGVDCWGYGVGATGNGLGGVESDVPVAIRGVTGAKSIATASGPTECALLADTNVECWGSNSDGLLGNGVDEAEPTTPVRVSDLTNAVSIVSGYGSAAAFCVLRKTGVIACWGSETYGLLGNGSSSVSAYSPVPVAARGLSTAVAVTQGTNGFCALLKTGGVDCWGANLTQVPRGPGNQQYSTVPVPVAGLGS